MLQLRSRPGNRRWDRALMGDWLRAGKALIVSAIAGRLSLPACVRIRG
jgi:hypothetical protein